MNDASRFASPSRGYLSGSSFAFSPLDNNNNNNNNNNSISLDMGQQRIMNRLRLASVNREAQVHALAVQLSELRGELEKNGQSTNKEIDAAETNVVVADSDYSGQNGFHLQFSTPVAPLSTSSLLHLADSLRAQLVEKDGTLRSVTDRLEQTEKQNRSLLAETKSMKTELEQLKSNFVMKDAAHASLEAECNARGQALEALEKQMKSLESDRSQLHNRVEAQARIIKEQGEQLEDVGRTARERDHYEGLAKSLEEELKTCQFVRGNERTELLQKIADRSLSSQEEAAAHRMAVSLAEAESARVRAERDVLRATSEERAQMIAELKKELQESKSGYEARKADILQLENQLRVSRGETDSTRSELMRVTSQISVLEQVKGECSKLRSELDAALAECGRIPALNEELKRIGDLLAKESEQLRQSRADSNHQANIVAGLEAELEGLKLQVSEAEKRELAVERARNEAIAECNSVKMEMVVQMNKVRENEDVAVRQKWEIARLHEQNQKLKQAASMTEVHLREAKRLERELSDTRTQSRSLSDHADKKLVEIEQHFTGLMKKQQSELENCRTDSRAREQQLLAEISTLKQELQSTSDLHSITVHSLKREASNLQEQLSRRANDLSSALFDAETSRKLARDLSARNEEYHSELGACREKLKSALDDLEEMQKEADSKVGQLREMCQQELARAHERCDATVEAAKRKADSEIEKIRRESASDIAEMTRRNEEQHQMATEKMVTELRALRMSSMGQLEEERKRREAEMNDLRLENESVKRDRDAKVQSVKDAANSEVQSLKKTYSENVARLEMQLRHQAEIYKEALTDFEKKMASCKEVNRQREAEIERLTQSLKLQEEALDRAEGMRGEARKAKDAAEERAADLESQLRTLNGENARVRSDMEMLKVTSASEINLANSSSRDEIRLVEEENRIKLAKAHSEKELLQSQLNAAIASLQSEKAALQRELGEVRSRFTSSSKELDVSRTESSGLKEALTELRTKFSISDMESSKIMGVLEGKLNQMAVQLQERDAQLERVRFQQKQSEEEGRRLGTLCKEQEEHIATSNVMIENALGEMERLKAAKSEMEAELSFQKEKLSSLQQDAAVSASTILRMSDDVGTLRSNLDSAQAALAEKTKELYDCKAIVGDIHEREVTTRNLLDAEVAKTKSLRSQLEQCRLEMAESERVHAEKISVMQSSVASQLSSMQRTVESVTADSAETVRATKHEFVKEIQALQSRNAQLEENGKALARDLESQRSFFSSREEELSTRLMAELRDAVNRAEKAETDAIRCKVLNEALEKQHEEDVKTTRMLQDSLSSLQEDCRKKQEELVTTLESCMDQQQKIAKFKAAAEQYETEIQVLRDKNAAKDEKLSSMTQSVAFLESEALSARVGKERAVEDLKKTQDECSLLRKSLEEMQSSIGAARVAEKSLEECRSELDNLRKNAQIATERAGDVEKALAMETALGLRLREELEEITERYVKAEEYLTALKTQVLEKNREHDAGMAEYKKLVQGLEREVERLTSGGDELNRELAKLSQLKKAEESTAKAFKDMVDLKDKDHAATKSALQECVQSLEQTKEELRKVSRSTKDLEVENEALKRQLEWQKSCLESRDGDVASQNVRIRELESRLEDSEMRFRTAAIGDRTEKEAISSELVVCKQDLKNCEKALENAHSESEIMRGKIAQLQGIIDTNAEEIRKYQPALVQCKELISKMERQLETALTTCKLRDVEVAQYQARLRECQAEIAAIRNK